MCVFVCVRMCAIAYSTGNCMCVCVCVFVCVCAHANSTGKVCVSHTHTYALDYHALSKSEREGTMERRIWGGYDE